MNMYLIREPEQSMVTKGQLVLGDNPFTCCTLELPWKNNFRLISCIPNGLYKWRKVGPTKNIPYAHIEIIGVLNRNGIKIHIVNYAAGVNSEIEGCIGVGSSFYDLDHDGIDDIRNSRKTFEKLMDLLPDEGTIEIRTRGKNILKHSA